eukprot:TRINITY_DN109817_c0_g1_i1.p1 TRINITY_DN109817_c0_g1~~TRINITY_DN109817_c0_g1_i1.p1  ORF type:complete len:453 (-),score=65.92 TRINITY_DN109817_c0_g1_i1:53-1411(-)
MGADRSWRDDDRDSFDEGYSRKGKGKSKGRHELTKPCIWLGGLPADISESEVSRVCDRFGVISDIAIKNSDRDTFVFVTFGRIEHAQEAIDELNQSNAFGSGVIKAAPATRRSDTKGEKGDSKGDSGWHSSSRWEEGKRDDDQRGRHQSYNNGSSWQRDDRGGGRSRDNYDYDDYNRGRDDRDYGGGRSDRERNDRSSGGRYDDHDRGGGNRYEDHDRGDSHRGDYRGGYSKGKGKSDRGGKGDNRYGDEDHGSGRYGDSREGGGRGGGRGMERRYEGRADDRHSLPDDRNFRDEPRRAHSERDPRDRIGGPGAHATERRDFGPPARPRTAYRPAGAVGAAGGSRRLATRSRSPPPRMRMQERGVRIGLANLPSDMDEAELKDTAAAYGKVLDLRIFSGGANNSKRGWVEYGTMREAEYAVSELDDRSMAEWHLLLRAYIDTPPQVPGRERR